MYSAFIGVAISWPEWDALAPSSFLVTLSFRHFPGYRFSGAPGSTVFAISWFAGKPGRNLKLRSVVVVGLQMWDGQPISSLALGQAHVQSIRLRSLVVLTAGDKPLLLNKTAQAMRAILLASATVATCGAC